MIRVMLTVILAAVLLLVIFAIAMMQRIAQIMVGIENMPWEMIGVSDMLHTEEADKNEKPPDRRNPQALADDKYKTPMARRSSERLTRRRNEAMG